MPNETTKKVYTKDDQLSAFKASKKYNLDKAKTEILMRKLYTERAIIPGTGFKEVMTGTHGHIKLNPDPRAHEYFLKRYSQEFNQGH